MAQNITIGIANTAEEIAAVKTIFLEYMEFIENYLGESLGFQGTEKEFADFPDVYDALFLAKIDLASVN